MCTRSPDPRHRPPLVSEDLSLQHLSSDHPHRERPDSDRAELSALGEAPMDCHLSSVTRAFMLPILFYRKYISPLTPPSCRFTPTCSQYALDAYRHYGAFRGSWYTLTRLFKCHPWHAGGYDPVIVNEKNSEKKKPVRRP